METTYFELSLKPNDSNNRALPTIYANQYDDGRRFTATIYDVDGTVYNFTDETVTLVGTKPSGTGFSYTATASGNTVTFDTTGQMTVVNGVVRCGLIITKGDVQVGTIAFYLYVQKAALQAETVIDSDDFGSIITDAVVDWMTEHGIPIDTTLSVAGSAADAKATGDSVSGLKGAFDTVSDRELGVVILTNWVSGYILTNGTTVDVTDIRSSSSYWCQVASCVPGDVFHIKTEGASTSARPWCWIKSDGTKISNANVNVVDTDIVAPAEAAYLVCNARYSVGTLIKGVSRISALESFVADTAGNVEYLTKAVDTVAPDLVAGSFYDYTNGGVITNSNFHRTNLLPIPDGTTAIRLNFYNSITGNDGYAFFDENNAYISGGHNAESGMMVYAPLTIYPIPANAKTIAASGRISYEESGVPRTVTFINDIIKKSTSANSGETVVMLGDSIIGNYNGSDSVPRFLEQMSGATCYNCAFGGSTMGSDTVSPVFGVLEAFNGWRIIKAIAENDYSAQLQAIADDPTYEHLKSYFADHVATLQAMDWQSVDVISLSYGTNDWGLMVPLDNADYPYDTNTFGGAMRTALEKLWSVYPHIKVMACGCIWRGLTISDGEVTVSTDDGAVGRLAPLKDYEDKIKSVAEQYHVPFVAMYNHTNFNAHTWTQYFHNTDATHPARLGRYVIAKRYAQYLAEL